MPTENYAIVCNPKSGKGNPLKVLPAFREYLNSKNIAHRVFSDFLPETLVSFTCLVVMGGDGSLNYAINHFKNISIPIALIRCGTGNDYATLHLEKAKLNQQFEIATQENSIWVDAGICNGKKFINGVGIGFDGWVVRKNLGKQFFTGKLAYLSTILSLLLFYRESEYTIEIDGQTIKQPVFMLSAAKGKTYGGGFKVAPLADPTDGYLDFIGVKKISLLNRLRYLPVIEKGKHLHLPFVFSQKAKSIKIKASHPLQAHLDGEYMESDTFEIEVIPKAYRVKSVLG